jgi:hypothetical protein
MISLVKTLLSILWLIHLILARIILSWWTLHGFTELGLDYVFVCTVFNISVKIMKVFFSAEY